MKLIRTIAVGASLALAIPVAGAQSPDTTHRPVAGAKAQGEARGQKSGPGQWRRGEDRAIQPHLRGLDLTDAQKQQVRVIVERYQPQRQALVEQMRQRRESGQRPDSTFLAGIRQQREALQARQLADIRTVLTAEQQVRFDANVAKFREREAKRAEKAREKREKQGGKAGRPGRSGSQG